MLIIDDYEPEFIERVLGRCACGAALRATVTTGGENRYTLVISCAGTPRHSVEQHGHGRRRPDFDTLHSARGLCGRSATVL